MSIWKQDQAIPAALPRCGCCNAEIRAQTYHHIEFLSVGFNVCPVCLKKWKRNNKEMEELRK